jgi:hypothetical protein
MRREASSKNTRNRRQTNWVLDQRTRACQGIEVPEWYLDMVSWYRYLESMVCYIASRNWHERVETMPKDGGSCCLTFLSSQTMTWSQWYREWPVKHCLEEIISVCSSGFEQRQKQFGEGSEYSKSKLLQNVWVQCESSTAGSPTHAHPQSSWNRDNTFDS